MSMNSGTKPESPNVSFGLDNTLIAALLISQGGKRVLVACYDQQRIDELGKQLSKIRCCPEYWMYQAGQTPTASLVDAIEGTARIAFITYDALQFVISEVLDLEQWDVIVDAETHCGVISVPRSGETPTGVRPRLN